MFGGATMKELADKLRNSSYNPDVATLESQLSDLLHKSNSCGENECAELREFIKKLIGSKVIGSPSMLSRTKGFFKGLVPKGFMTRKNKPGTPGSPPGSPPGANQYGPRGTAARAVRAPTPPGFAGRMIPGSQKRYQAAVAARNQAIRNANLQNQVNANNASRMQELKNNVQSKVSEEAQAEFENPVTKDSIKYVDIENNSRTLKKGDCINFTKNSETVSGKITDFRATGADFPMSIVVTDDAGEVNEIPLDRKDPVKGDWTSIVPCPDKNLEVLRGGRRKHRSSKNRRRNRRRTHRRARG